MDKTSKEFADMLAFLGWNDSAAACALGLTGAHRDETIRQWRKGRRTPPKEVMDRVRAHAQIEGWEN